VTWCRAIASVAFNGKFWSMQTDCGRALFGLFFGLAAFRFKAGESQKGQEERE
jgi:hypothetical protein